jgi:hypothetical protein
MQNCYVSNASSDHVRAFPFLTILRTGVMLGFDRLVLNIIVLTAESRALTVRTFKVEYSEERAIRWLTCECIPRGMLLKRYGSSTDQQRAWRALTLR